MIDTDILKVVRDGAKPGDLVVVTGSSRGFGRAIARRLARLDVALACWDLLEEQGQETVALCLQEGARDAKFYKVDMGDPVQVTASVESVVEQQGIPYGIVNNAGIYRRSKLLDTPLEMWEQAFRVNLTGAFVCAREFVKHMSKVKRGSIVNMGSGRGMEGAVGGAHYGASKAAIINLTRSMALEWAPYGIRVNSIIPGVSLTQSALNGVSDVDELLRRGKKIPLGRIGHPDDIAGVVAFLLSPSSSNMTGQAIPINGGHVMLPY